MFQVGNPSEQLSANLLAAVYDGVKAPLNASSQTINLTPASQQLASKLLDLAYDLGLKVCEIGHIYINVNQ